MNVAKEIDNIDEWPSVTEYLSMYQQFVESLIKPEEIDMMQAHMTLGLAGEAGETADMVKKSIFYERPMDREAMTKELGDVLYYLTAVAALYNIRLFDVLNQNVKKLSARYPDGVFSTQDAIARKDETRTE